MRGSRFVVSAVALLLSWSGLAHAHSDGTKTVGYSGIDPTKTCNNCHSGGTESKITFIGPASLALGEVGDYSVVIANSSPTAKLAGVDIAADNPQAQLDAAGGTDILAGSDLVHNTPVPFVDGQVTFSFKLTAPSTPGTVIVYADGMEANLLDDPTSGDYGTVGTMQVVIGGGAPGGSGSGGGSAAPGKSGMGCSASPAATRAGSPSSSGLAAAGLALGVALTLRRRRRDSTR